MGRKPRGIGERGGGTAVAPNQKPGAAPGAAETETQPQPRNQRSGGRAGAPDRERGVIASCSWQKEGKRSPPSPAAAPGQQQRTLQRLRALGVARAEGFAARQPLRWAHRHLGWRRSPRGSREGRSGACATSFLACAVARELGVPAPGAAARRPRGTCSGLFGSLFGDSRQGRAERPTDQGRGAGGQFCRGTGLRQIWGWSAQRKSWRPSPLRRLQNPRASVEAEGEP